VNADATALLGALDALVDLVAARVVAQLQAGDVGMIDQTASPLGNRRHIKRVRELVAAGESGACKVGRRYLMTRERLDAELAGLGVAAPVDDEIADLRAKFQGAS
jgi:phage shock protein A